MAFNHRKMLYKSENTTLPDCTLYCGPELEGEFYCHWPCMQFCSPDCPHPPPPIPTIDQTDPPRHGPRHVHRFSLLFTVSLTAVAAAFFLLCVFTIYKYYTGRRSSRRGSQARTEEIHDDLLDEDHGPVLDHPIWYIRTVGLQPSVISSIAVCKYKRGDGLIEGTECAVCLSEFEEDETLRLLPKCNHAFHIPCIDTWLRSHTNCPLCRARIVINSVAVGLHLPESNTDNSGVGEETQVGISDNDGESGRETQNEGSEVRIGVEEGGALQVDSGRKSNGNSIEEGGSSDVQPVRRSVSLDNLSASIISLAVTNGLRAQSSGNSDNQLIKLNDSNMANASKRVAANQSLLRLVGSSSIGRSLQRGPSSVKRSLSCSGKLFLSRYCRSGNSVRPH